MAQYSYFRRTGTNLKTAGVSPQVAWYGIATIQLVSHECDLIQLQHEATGEPCATTRLLRP